MPRRRGNREGTLYQRPDGRYQARLSYIDAATGKPRRISVYADTAPAARRKLKTARDRLDAGAPVKDAKRTAGDWLSYWRATTLAVSNRKDATRALYANLSRKHLESGAFGAITLDRLRPTDVEALILALRAATRPGPRNADGTPGEPVRALSDSTIRSIYTVLRAGLDGAVRDGLLAKNPAALVKRPGIRRREAKHLESDGVAALLAATAESRYHPALVLIASTGLRKGECLALAWDHVDLHAATIKVDATLARIDGQLVVSEAKTDRSRRTVPLHPGVVAMLTKHRRTQKTERLRAGDRWQGSGLVFTTDTGGPVDPRNFLRVIETAAKAAGVAGVGVHTLRHSAAVAWLEAGTHIKAVADLLGHSSIAVTGDVYGHSTDATARTAIDGLGGRLGL
jgi:integrase